MMLAMVVALLEKPASTRSFGLSFYHLLLGLEMAKLSKMHTVTFLTITDQVAEHLRREILRGRWTVEMPGKHQLAAELGVNNKTVEAALRQLEQSGLLVARGAGRKRLLNPNGCTASRVLHVAILLNEGAEERKTAQLIEVHHALADAGHTVTFAHKALTELQFDPDRIADHVQSTRADAWVVCAGSRPVLEWFSNQPLPAFALFGHRIGLRIPSVSPEKTSAIGAATRRLLALGHRRIVLLCRKIRRLPQPGPPETVFLDTLRAHSCPVGEFNLPDWEEGSGGFQACLEALFRVTPPTAMIVDESQYLIAAMQFFLTCGICVPKDVSLVCTDGDPVFAQCIPPIAHIAWDSLPVTRRVVHWASNVSRGKPDFRQTLTSAQFVEGGTIAPARAR
jgi:DNA-binding LacI/PurR family transcriptional regulator